MSQLANFYVLPADRFDDLIAAQTARVVTVEKRRFFVLKTKVEKVVTEGSEFLRAVAREPEECPFPGFVFADIDALLEERGLALFDLAQPDLSERLSRAMDTEFEARGKRTAWGAKLHHKTPVFDHPTALQALSKLASCELTKANYRAYAKEHYPAEEREAAMLTMPDALALTHRWLGSVAEGEIGFLHVG